MNPAPFLSRTASRILLLMIWAAVSIALLIANWHFIGPLNFRDPDDALRLVQVRDLLAGQSWFDLTQHRIHPPAGVPMHWSRLVDLPIALLLAGLKPLLGTWLAERATIGHRAARAAAGADGRDLQDQPPPGPGHRNVRSRRRAARHVHVHPHPVRAFAHRHHGAQILCGAVAMMALVEVWRRDGHMGLIAGIAMACWLQISIEGLPCAVAMGGVLACGISCASTAGRISAII